MYSLLLLSLMTKSLMSEFNMKGVEKKHQKKKIKFESTLTYSVVIGKRLLWDLKNSRIKMLCVLITDSSKLWKLTIFGIDKGWIFLPIVVLLLYEIYYLFNLAAVKQIVTQSTNDEIHAQIASCLRFAPFGKQKWMSGWLDIALWLFYLLYLFRCFYFCYYILSQPRNNYYWAYSI